MPDYFSDLNLIYSSLVRRFSVFVSIHIRTQCTSFSEKAGFPKDAQFLHGDKNVPHVKFFGTARQSILRQKLS